MKITLNQIKKKNPCKDWWEKLLKGLNKTQADDEEFEVEFILKNNGLDNFCWILDKVLNKQKELRLFAYWNAKNCLKYVPKEEKKEFSKVINTINLFAYGKVGESGACACTWASACACACACTWASASASANDKKEYLKKAEKKLLKILKGDLPKMYTGNNHY